MLEAWYRFYSLIFYTIPLVRDMVLKSRELKRYQAVNMHVITYTYK